ncbi:MAG: M36 family metallopeptidase [Stagnimonas sp.]|nr:M36 family metallopeptidase [Stagnimonas sp.]
MTVLRLFLRTTLSLALVGSFGAASASEPASHDVTLAGTPGETVIVEWEGTANPGATGAGNTCAAAETDDAHAVNLSLPANFYETGSLNADFHIEWAESPAVDPTGTVHDPDLVLAVQDGEGNELGASDGGSPEENVGATNPPAGTLTAIVCPFFASAPTPYKGKLTLTVRGEAMCLTPPKVLAHSTVTSALAAGGFDEADQYRLPNFDRFLQEATGQLAALPARGLEGRRQPVLFDRNLGKPTFLWARNNTRPLAVGALNPRELLIARARAHLRSEAKLLGLSDALIDQAEVTDAQYNGDGPAVVRFRQRVNGYQVHHRSLNVLLDRAGAPVAVSGYFATDYDPASLAGLRFERSAAQAISAAWGSFGGNLPAGQLLRTGSHGGFDQYSTPSLGSQFAFERAPRAKALYYPRAGRLEPAYEVELFVTGLAPRRGLLAYSFIVSAVDGTLLNRANLSANATAYTYRVFADPNGIHQPYDEPTGNDLIPFPFADPDAPITAPTPDTNLITLISGPISTGDPWLPDGATETTGNHTDACIDNIDIQGVPIAVPPPVNSCVPDLEPRATTTSANTFDYPLKAFDDPAAAAAKSAAVVNLFYTINWLHDWWYDHGFDEVSGNAQTSNYGRGGAEADPLLAQGQDGSGRNNANMATPADGSSPVMQQYLFNGLIKGKVEVTSHPAIGSIQFNAVEYGPQTFDYTGTAAVVDDGFDPTNDGCTGLSTPAGPAVPVFGSPTVPLPVPTPDPGLVGKIAVIVRGGGCPGSYKVRLAVQSGASAVLLVHNGDGPPPYLANGDIPIDAPVQPTNTVYQVPIAVIRQDDGQAIMDAIAAGETVTVSMLRQPTIDLDGTLDNLIIAHEYFHYVHNRLADAGNNQARSMGEGWGDINAFMLAARDGERSLPGNEQYQGAYPGATYVTQSYFYGIRRAPYSTDLTKNAFTFKHIADGELTPDGGDGSINSEVHNSGEIWANMMWECYVGLLNDPRYSFAQAQSRMKDYIIGGFKMTPADATFTEARDAVLSVALARDFGDYTACSKGFAKRGIGLNAVSPARSSTDHVGVVEDPTEFVCKVDGPGGGSSSGGTSSGGSSSGGSSGSGSSGRFGGSLNLLLLLPLLLLGLGRRRVRS